MWIIRSDALARQLFSRGFGPSARVGVIVDRTADLVLVPLAILKTGNAYVPLDPTYPPGRLPKSSNNRGWLQSSRNRRSCRPPCAPCRSLRAVAPLTPRRWSTNRSLHPHKGYCVRHFYLGFDQPTKRREEFARHIDQLSVCHARNIRLHNAGHHRCGYHDLLDVAALELFLPLTLGARGVITSEEETKDGRLLLSLLKRAKASFCKRRPRRGSVVEAG